MKIYAMGDLHGCLREFEAALSTVLKRLDEKDTKLVILGDYIDGGGNDKGVMDRVIELQREYGADKVIALLGNHDEWFMRGNSEIDDNFNSKSTNSVDDAEYISWLRTLPLYYVEGNTIFVHAGIDEEAGEYWELGTAEEIFTSKYPAETGSVVGLENKKIVAGHVGTAEISGNSDFHDIFYDGKSHYYVDGSVLVSGNIPILMVDTKEDRYYQVIKDCNELILPYGTKR